MQAGSVAERWRCSPLRAFRAAPSKTCSRGVVEGVLGMSVADEIVTFERDIKPLFRPMDYESMAWAFDLSSYDEVKDHATAILDRLRDGSMPCDAEWPEEQVEQF